MSSFLFASCWYINRFTLMYNVCHYDMNAKTTKSNTDGMARVRGDGVSSFSIDASGSVSPCSLEKESFTKLASKVARVLRTAYADLPLNEGISGSLTPASVHLVINGLLDATNRLDDNPVLIDAGCARGHFMFLAACTGRFSRCLGVDLPSNMDAIKTTSVLAQELIGKSGIPYSALHFAGYDLSEGREFEEVFASLGRLEHMAVLYSFCAGINDDAIDGLIRSIRPSSVMAVALVGAYAKIKNIKIPGFESRGKIGAVNMSGSSSQFSAFLFVSSSNDISLGDSFSPASPASIGRLPGAANMSISPIAGACVGSPSRGGMEEGSSSDISFSNDNRSSMGGSAAKPSMSESDSNSDISFPEDARQAAAADESSGSFHFETDDRPAVALGGEFEGVHSAGNAVNPNHKEDSDSDDSNYDPGRRSDKGESSADGSETSSSACGDSAGEPPSVESFSMGMHDYEGHIWLPLSGYDSFVSSYIRKKDPVCHERFDRCWDVFKRKYTTYEAAECLEMEHSVNFLMRYTDDEGEAVHLTLLLDFLYNDRKNATIDSYLHRYCRVLMNSGANGGSPGVDVKDPDFPFAMLHSRYPTHFVVVDPDSGNQLKKTYMALALILEPLFKFDLVHLGDGVVDVPCRDDDRALLSLDDSAGMGADGSRDESSEDGEESASDASVLETIRALSSFSSTGVVSPAHQRLVLRILKMAHFMHRRTMMHTRLSVQSLMLTEDGRVVIGDAGYIAYSVPNISKDIMPYRIHFNKQNECSVDARRFSNLKGTDDQRSFGRGGVTPLDVFVDSGGDTGVSPFRGPAKCRSCADLVVDFVFATGVMILYCMFPVFFDWCSNRHTPSKFEKKLHDSLEAGISGNSKTPLKGLLDFLIERCGIMRGVCDGALEALNDVKDNWTPTEASDAMHIRAVRRWHLKMLLEMVAMMLHPREDKRASFKYVLSFPFCSNYIPDSALFDRLVTEGYRVGELSLRMEFGNKKRDVTVPPSLVVLVPGMGYIVFALTDLAKGNMAFLYGGLHTVRRDASDVMRSSAYSVHVMRCGDDTVIDGTPFVGIRHLFNFSSVGSLVQSSRSNPQKKMAANTERAKCVAVLVHSKSESPEFHAVGFVARKEIKKGTMFNWDYNFFSNGGGDKCSYDGNDEPYDPALPQYVIDLVARQI